MNKIIDDNLNALEKLNCSLLKLKIPINVGVVYDYEDLFKYVLRKGFIPEPYLSSSPYSIRADQNNIDNFVLYMTTFLRYKRELKILPGFVHLVYNTRSGGSEVEVHIDKTVKQLLKMGYEENEINLILSYPPLVMKYINAGFNVTVSSSSILAYKKIIDILVNRSVRQQVNVSYVLPSTYQFVIDNVPPGSFELLLNNGCLLGCPNATVTTDHTKFCPVNSHNQEELYYGKFVDRTDLIRRGKFNNLLKLGWNHFKISGRAATMSLIFDVVKYYLKDEESLPYIDNHTFYGKSSNGLE